MYCVQNVKSPSKCVRDSRCVGGRGCTPPTPLQCPCILKPSMIHVYGKTWHHQVCSRGRLCGSFCLKIEGRSAAELFILAGRATGARITCLLARWLAYLSLPAYLRFFTRVFGTAIILHCLVPVCPMRDSCTSPISQDCTSLSDASSAQCLASPGPNSTLLACNIHYVSPHRPPLYSPAPARRAGAARCKSPCRPCFFLRAIEATRSLHLRAAVRWLCPVLSSQAHEAAVAPSCIGPTMPLTSLTSF